MLEDPTFGDVFDLVASALSGDTRRWTHVQGVARRAGDLRPAIEQDDGDLLVRAAWLHDIGYGDTVRSTGFHPLDGARYLERLSYPARLVRLVAHHSGARFEAEQRGLSDDLAQYELEDSPVMDALICADLTTSPDGNPVTFSDRLDEILVRYPPDSVVHRAMVNATPTLEAAVERTRKRLADVGVATSF